MPPKDLETTLRTLANAPLPTCPDQLATDVWREIARRRKTTRWPLILWIHDGANLFAQPHMAAAGIAFALILGIVPAVVFSEIRNTQQVARQSIHFDIFSREASAGLVAPLFKPVTLPPSS